MTKPASTRSSRRAHRDRLRGSDAPDGPERGDRSDRQRADRVAPARRPRTALAPRRSVSAAARRARRIGLVRLGVLVLIVVGLAALTYGLLATSMLGVRSVQVRGMDVLTAEQVRTAAAVRPGEPMLRLDQDAIVARVSELAPVAEVEIDRSWPSTVVVAITEREPVAFVKAGDRVRLIDRTGLAFATKAEAPPGLVELRAGDGEPTAVAVAVLNVLDHRSRQQLREQVVAVVAESPADVRLQLTGGRTARWGSAEESERKADVLAVLLTQPGKVYDVISPDLPTIR